MKNYLYVSGEKVELTEDQATKIMKEIKGEKTSLKEISVGDIFKIGEHEFIVLEQLGDTTAVICKNLLHDSKFGENNNYKGSTVELQCNRFADEIAVIIGADNIVEHAVDLTANDGLKDYGTIKSRCSLPTADRYRRYVEILEKFKLTDWWWLSTPASTKKHENDVWILCVSPSGFIGYVNVNYGFGVRPFCILKSTIFVSM